MDIQMYLSLEGVSKRSFPLKFTSAGRWQRRLSVWGAQLRSGFRSVNNCLTLEPIQNAGAVQFGAGRITVDAREKEWTAPMMHQNGTQLQHPRAPGPVFQSVFYVSPGRDGVHLSSSSTALSTRATPRLKCAPRATRPRTTTV